MPASVREICACIGLTGNISILNGFFGYRRNIIASLDNIASSDSLLKQMKLLKSGAHVNLNIIQVGINRYNSQFELIERAIRKMRSIYTQVNIGIGRIEYYGYETVSWVIIHDDCEAADLTNSMSIPNDGLDVFLVDFWPGSTIGRSATDGPCDKSNDLYEFVNAMTGSVIAIGDPFSDTPNLSLVNGANEIAQVIAHEVGHYLGLEHYYDLEALAQCLGADSLWSPDEIRNCLPAQPPAARSRLMFPSMQSNGSNIAMTAEEGDTMREHCFTFECK